MASDPRDTPAMQQYYRFKKRHPDCVLLFRMGDFYETFDDDAVTISRALGLTLTQRSAGVPMAGVPYHQLENYLRRLVQQGFRVAVAEQMEDPAQAKGIVRRAVTRVITPGTLLDESLLTPESSGTLAAVCFTESGDESPAALAVVDASTGAFTLTDVAGAALVDELARRGVRELIYAQLADGKNPPRIDRVLTALGLSATPRPPWHFRAQEAREALLAHLGVATLGGFGLRDDDPAIPAAGAILRYLMETQTPEDEGSAPKALAHLHPPRREDPAGFLTIDAVSLRALEVERTIRGPGGAAPVSPAGDGSLLGVFHAAPAGQGRCRTTMGKRLLRDWLVRPLGRAQEIRDRQNAVSVFHSDRRTADAVGEILDRVQDVARIAARLALLRATPRDLVALARSLATITALADAIDNAPALAPHQGRLRELAGALAPLAQRISAMCVDDPPPTLGKPGKEAGVFREGVDPELDEARSLQRDAGDWLARYQQRLVQEHNLPIGSGAVKVGYNSVFGYYIELTTAQARSAPAAFIRKQTLKNAERYTTVELREFEGKVSTAEARAAERERVLFDGLVREAAAQADPIARFGECAAELDVLLSFADRAAARGWVRPMIADEPVLTIAAGRHPVLEVALAGRFVPNDVALGGGEGPVALITGPNMAGKSTFIRQTALIAILAHTGSFVPADSATIGVVDRVFTRVGADDALFAGQSTFMVEMTETANILHHATTRSLIVLDEVGRGTSTLDGLSLAWAIAEHIGGAFTPPPRTLFATHYHELTTLEDDARFAGRVRNLHVAVREWPPGDEHASIVFLHRILPGRTDQSYGVHVAKLAGIPTPVIGRARELLATLALSHGMPVGPAVPALPGALPRRPRKAEPLLAGRAPAQASLFGDPTPHPAVDRLRELKLETLSPLQAFDLLRTLKDMAGGEGVPKP